MSASRGRIQKRMQACENCRRKKTRCPGERPACSTCTRLHQNCTYTQSNVNLHENGKDWEGRLAQLEGQMNLILEQSMPNQDIQGETPRSIPAQSWSQRDSPRSVPHPAATPSTMPPKEIVVEMIDVYFQHCHMQPLWLFDRNDLAQPDECSEEVILALMALALLYSRDTRFQGQTEELNRHYAQLARDRIMLRVAQGNVKLSTIQSLCMLAFASFIATDMHFASLFINMALTFLKCADMDVESRPDELSAAAEAHRRLFWSLHLLNQIYGQHQTMLNVLTNIDSPKYVGWEMDLQRESSLAPPSMPQEMCNEGQTQKGGIWAYMVQLSTLWKEVRKYVIQCADNNTKAPWSADSGYTVICAHLMDLETKLPTVHRYDSARFPDQSTEDLRRNRAYWSPWLCIQFTYHSIHSMLNHPFLYSSRPQQSAQLAVPNTFWKTSSELALIHTTWIVRLIEIISEKSYQVSDPFIGHCAAIAASILVYFCRSVDARLRQAAQSRLTRCTTFLNELAIQWPVCQMMHDRLQSLIKSAFGPHRNANEQESSPRTVWINTSLMWLILDYTYVGKPRTRLRGKALLHESLCQNTDESDEEDETVETHIFHNSTREVDTSDGGQALPPFSDHTVRRDVLAKRARNRRHGERAMSSSVSASAPPAGGYNMAAPNSLLPERAPWPGVITGDASVMDVTYDPFMQFQDPGSPFLGIWEVGNL